MPKPCNLWATLAYLDMIDSPHVYSSLYLNTSLSTRCVLLLLYSGNACSAALLWLIDQFNVIFGQNNRDLKSHDGPRKKQGTKPLILI